MILPEKKVVWADGGQETIAIDANGGYILNRQPVKCLSMELGLGGFSFGGEYWYSANKLALMTTELAWLRAHGIRFLHVNVDYATVRGAETSRIASLLSTIHTAKLFCIPQIHFRFLPEFNDLAVEDYTIDGENVSSVCQRVVAQYASYPNVIGIYLENELDFLEAGETYSAAQAGSHLGMLHAASRAVTDLPLYSRVIGGITFTYHDTLQPYSAMPVYDIYLADADAVQARIELLQAHLATVNKGPAVVIAELGIPDATTWYTAYLTPVVLDRAFGAGATEVGAMVANNLTEVKRFFNQDGTPNDRLLALAAYATHNERASGGTARRTVQHAMRG